MSESHTQSSYKPQLGIINPIMGMNQSPASTATGLADALFPRVRQRVLAVFFGTPDRSFYANEVIALAQSGTGAVQRELAGLSEAGLLTVSKQGNQKHYQANADAPVFAELQARKALAAELPLKRVLREHKEAVVLWMLLTWLLSAGIVVVILMTPTFLQKLYAVAPAEALRANSLAIVALTVGCMVAGRLCDWLGSGVTFICGSLALALSCWHFYTGLQGGTEQLFSSYALAGFCVGIVGAVPYVMVNAFPAVVRFSGLSFSYNLAYAIFGGLTPMLVTLWLKSNPLAPAHYVVSLCGVGLLVGLYLCWQERRRGPLLAEVAG